MKLSFLCQLKTLQQFNRSLSAMTGAWQGSQVGFWRVASFPAQDCLFSTWEMGIIPTLFHCQGPWTYPRGCPQSERQVCPLQKPLVIPCTSQVATEVTTVRPQLYYTEGKEEWINWDGTGEVLWRDPNSPAWWYENNESQHWRPC